MSRTRFFPMIAALAVASLACGIRIPITEVKTGPTQTETIQVARPDTQDPVDLTLSFGAGLMSLAPGAENDLVEGTATYNVPDFRPQITVEGKEISIENGDLNIGGIPTFEGDIRNEWDLKLGAVPMNLTIKAGAYTGEFELGGLPLENLNVHDGASEVDLSFSEPNPSEMNLFSYSTGASDVTLSGLGNANFSAFTFSGGAGSYEIDFSGELQRKATVTIDAGISSVTLIVPEGVGAEVTFDGGLSNVSLSGDWEQSGSKYVQNGDTLLLTIRVKMGAGDLKLRNP